ncbi:MAG: hypothetical protein JW830_01275, partial [Bacteroidales bacterium]|nr:hypothetical protein [Bacteroidales bacterium]
NLLIGESSLIKRAQALGNQEKTYSRNPGLQAGASEIPGLKWDVVKYRFEKTVLQYAKTQYL